MAAKSRPAPHRSVASGQLSQSLATKLQWALAHHQNGDIRKAKAGYQEILKLQPKHFDCLHLLGVVAIQEQDFDLAVRLIRDAISINPSVAFAYGNLGNALKGLKRFDEALSSYESALNLNPNDPETHNNRGNALKEAGRLDDALASYDKALSLKPDYAKAHANRGAVMLELCRLDDALASYREALKLNPGDAETYNNQGNAQKKLGRVDEALASYQKALALKPDYAEVFFNCGILLQDEQKLDTALACYEKALALKPGYDFLLGLCLHVRAMLCDWKRFDADVQCLKIGISEFRKVSLPFPVVALLDDPRLQRLASQIYVEEMYPQRFGPRDFGERAAGQKIRIGYYSADFHNHATSLLMAELLETHDHQKFEIYGFSFGPEADDEVRKRISRCFDRFIDVRSVSDLEVARLSRELGIDIAVDLKGHTKDQRTGIFANGCAPVQVNYLGYPGTMGADYIHYVLADSVVIPERMQAEFTEKVVYLPHSYQVNDSSRSVSTSVFTRQDFGLPDDGFVFCCFNNNYKILPETFDIWMRILKAVNGSVLWLLEDNPSAAENLRNEAASRGVDRQRLVFAKRMKNDEHLARHQLADLFIDTMPCGAHTTASDALWAELPVLTCTGESFASRVAASLLTAVELPELVVETRNEYEAMAVALAQDPAKLREIKNKLQRNRLVAPLFNGRLFARGLEAAYEEMFRRSQAGLAPVSFSVDAA